MNAYTSTNQLSFDLPEVPEVPSIASSAMLVQLTIRQWGNNKLDKAASTELTDTKNAMVGSARVRKTLLPSCKEYAALQSACGALRRYVEATTLPWIDKGPRLLTTMAYFDFHREVTGRIAELERMADAFKQTYSFEVAKARAALGDLFNPDEYPTEDEVRASYSFTLNYMPVPEAGDFRLNITAEGQQYLKRQYTEHYRKQLEGAMGSVLGELTESLTHMADRLSVDDEGKKATFRDSMVENMNAMVEKLRTCNITGDPVLEAARQKLASVMAGVTAEDLRKSDGLRSKTRAEVRAVLDSLPSSLRL